LSDLFHTMIFRGQQAQPLRNVPVYTAAIVRIERGGKQLKWRDGQLRFGPENWLLVPANQRLTFINEPDNGYFRSCLLALLEKPSPELLSESTVHWNNPVFVPDARMKFGFDTLIEGQRQGLDESALRHYLHGFYQLLSGAGVLHQLFPGRKLSLSEQLCRYFATDPAAPYSQEEICRHFGLSKATLTRRLTEEGAGFRQLLADVRMGHALVLMQRQPLTQLELALGCGYQSERRFAERFREHFGITPAAYQKTLASPIENTTEN